MPNPKENLQWGFKHLVLMFLSMWLTYKIRLSGETAISTLTGFVSFGFFLFSICSFLSYHREKGIKPLK